MQAGRKRSLDRGQAFPLYVVVVAGLLFAALAFFVVGQASVTRSDAQGAADAAALAAGREARDGVFRGLDLAAVTSDDWKRIVDGGFFKVGGACAAAEAFAAKNDATATCVPSLPRFSVTVETKGTVGDSVIPGTDSMHGTAQATALIESKCTLVAAPTPRPTATAPTEGATPTPTPTPVPSTVNFDCGAEQLRLDPLKPGSITALTRRLFSVRLVS
ncbi:pilus assembly protein TadG-related protein [Streptomyces sp. NPDC058646]|uniref:pilus assembly protein TadG-related protein n=1 Tax=Streptomyces sp. NPDC058646 TaxID=3346574 RepID=UPI00364B3B5B